MSIITQLKQLITDGYEMVHFYDGSKSMDMNFEKFGEDQDRETVIKFGDSDFSIFWFERVRKVFENYDLDFKQFYYSSLIKDETPLPWMLNALKKMEVIIESPKKISLYIKDFDKQEVTYENAQLEYGGTTHKFSSKEYSKLFDVLWPKRKIRTKSGEIITQGKFVSKSEFKEETGINPSRLEEFQTGIRKISKEKQIPINLYYPNSESVYLEVTA